MNETEFKNLGEEGPCSGIINKDTLFIRKERKKMALYLVQHAKALPKEKDPAQPLSEEGKNEAIRIAKLAKEFGITVSLIEHSPKLRAKETAEIFAKFLKPSSGIRQRENINPLDDVRALKDELNPKENIMLVGHLPFMERLVSFLLTGSEEPMIVKFQNAGIVCLDKSPETDRWFIKWTLMPEVN